MKKAKILLTVLMGFAVTGANAYELATHAAATYNAYLASRLSQPTLRQDLGIDVLLADYTVKDPIAYLHPFGSTYYDVQGKSIQARSEKKFEEKVIASIKNTPIDNNPLNLSGWLMRGAIREDDSNFIFGVLSFSGEPLDDPYGNINRWCNHFFDPTQPKGSNAATFYCPGAAPLDAANWAVGANDAFAGPSLGENTGRRNHFTVYDAREALYRALTGKTKDGSDADPAASLLPACPPSGRNSAACRQIRST